jgi:hypothetical protein
MMTAELGVAGPPARTRRRDTDLDRQLADAAVSHPGGHPWWLRPVDGGVEIHVDDQRGAAPSPAGLHTMRITAGTAVRNLRLGVAMLGHRPVVTLFPPTHRGTVLAVVRRAAPAEPTAMERTLARIALQVGRFLPPVGEHPVPDAVVHRARAAVEAEGLWLRSVDDAARVQLAQAHSGVAAVPAMARLVVIGGNHEVASVHLQAGQALQSLVLATRLVGHTAAVAAWPIDLAAIHPMPESVAGRGGFPQLLVAIGVPALSAGPDPA